MAKKKEYARVILLSALWPDDTSWQSNVRESVGDGFTVADENECADPIKQFAFDELEHYTGDLVFYNFIGGEHDHEPARFYEASWDIFVEKATGLFWVRECEELYSF